MDRICFFDRILDNPAAKLPVLDIRLMITKVFFSPRLHFEVGGPDMALSEELPRNPCISLIQSELERLVDERSINENAYLRLSNLVLVTYKWDKIMRLAHELHVLALRDALLVVRVRDGRGFFCWWS